MKKGFKMFRKLEKASFIKKFCYLKVKKYRTEVGNMIYINMILYKVYIKRNKFVYTK